MYRLPFALFIVGTASGIEQWTLPIGGSISHRGAGDESLFGMRVAAEVGAKKPSEPHESLFVVKRDGSLELFDREKVSTCCCCTVFHTALQSDTHNGSGAFLSSLQ